MDCSVILVASSGRRSASLIDPHISTESDPTGSNPINPPIRNALFCRIPRGLVATGTVPVSGLEARGAVPGPRLEEGREDEVRNGSLRVRHRTGRYRLGTRPRWTGTPYHR